MRLKYFLFLTLLSLGAGGFAQDAGGDAPQDARQRAKAVRELAKSGGLDTIGRLAPYLADQDIGVRIEAVKGIVNIGTSYSLNPLVRALADVDPEVQIRATDGLVNFYLPGYLERGGLTSSPRRVGNSIKARFSGDNNQVIPLGVNVRPDVIAGIGKVARGGASQDARANAARAAGILRGEVALPDLYAALRSHDNQVMYETLMAIEKIGDPSAGPEIAYLLGDTNEKIQAAVLDATGLLRNRQALPRIRRVYERTRKSGIRNAALGAIARMPERADRTLLLNTLSDSHAELRASAAEGLGRLGMASDRGALEKAFASEGKPLPRMAEAFALALLGNREMTEFAPLRYLANQLNSVAWRGVAEPYLVELARGAEVRTALYPAIQGATKDEKTGMARVLGASGGADSIPALTSLSNDSDADAASAATGALSAIRARAR